jgi:hypothetical protein
MRTRLNHHLITLFYFCLLRQWPGFSYYLSQQALSRSIDETAAAPEAEAIHELSILNQFML